MNAVTVSGASQLTNAQLMTNVSTTCVTHPQIPTLPANIVMPPPKAALQAVPMTVCALQTTQSVAMEEDLTCVAAVQMWTVLLVSSATLALTSATLTRAVMVLMRTAWLVCVTSLGLTMTVNIVMEHLVKKAALMTANARPTNQSVEPMDNPIIVVVIQTTTAPASNFVIRLQMNAINPNAQRMANALQMRFVTF